MVVALVLAGGAAAPGGATTTSGGTATTADAGNAPGVYVADATIDDSSPSTIEVAYNATGVVSSGNLQVYISGANFTRSHSPPSATKGTHAFTIPAGTWGGGSQQVTVRLIDTSNPGRQLPSDTATITASSSVALQGYQIVNGPIDVGTNATVNATVKNTGGSADDFTVTLFDFYPTSPPTKSVNTSEKVTVPANSELNVTLNRTFHRTGTKYLTVNQEAANSVTVESPVFVDGVSVSDDVVPTGTPTSVTATLKNPGSKDMQHGLSFYDGSQTVQKQTTVPASGSAQLTFPASFGTGGAHKVFLMNNSGTIASPTIYALGDTSGTPNVQFGRVFTPETGVVDEQTDFGIELTNEGDASAVKNVSLTIDGTTTYDQVYLDPGDRAFAFLSRTFGSTGTYKGNINGTYDVNVTVRQPVVTDTAVTVASGPGSLPAMDASLSSQGMVFVQVRNNSRGMDLSSLGLTDSSKLAFNVTVDDFTPRVVMSTGRDVTWSTGPGPSPSETNVTITVSPERLDFLQNAPRIENWDTVSQDKADFGWDAALMLGISDGDSRFFDSDPQNLTGMTVSTDAQNFRPPRYYNASTDQGPKLELKLAGPHLTVNGDLNDGYYDTFLPNSLLDEWGVTSPSQLVASFSGSDTTVDVTQQSGGWDVNVSLHYSAGVATIKPDLNPPRATFDGDAYLDAGVTTSFDARASSDENGISSYEWDFGDGTTSTDETPRHTYDETGTYTVELTVTDDAGNSDTTSMVVTVRDVTAPSVALSPPDDAVAGASLAFDASDSTDDVGVASHTWTFGDGTTASGANVTHVFDAPGTYEVTLTVADATGNAANESLTLDVADARAPTAVAGPDRTVDEGTSLAFDASDSTDDGEITSYAWDFGDGATATGANVTHAFDAPGTYNATLTVADAAGNTATDTRVVTVADAEAPAVVVGDDRTIELGATASFDASDSTDDGRIARYRWTFDDGETATGANVTHAFDAVGTHEVTVTVADAAGNEATAELAVEVEDVTAPTAEAGDAPTATVGQSVTLDASDSTDDGGIESYAWDFDDGATATGATVAHAFDAPGTYEVAVTVTDAAGNEASDTVEVVVAATTTTASGTTETATGEADGSTTAAGDEGTSGATTEGDAGTGGPAQTDGASTTETGGVPGFGPLVALFALLAGAAVAARR